MNLARMMTDKFFLEDQQGARSGPFKTKFGSGTLMVFQDELRIAEGDRVIQPLADGGERTYCVEDFSRSAGSRNVPAHYAIKVSEAVATSGAGTHSVMAQEASLAHGVPPGRSALAASMQLLAQAVDDASFPVEQKDEAKKILRTLLAHPVVAGVLADAARKA